MSHATPIDLLLVNPGDRHRAYQGLGNELSAIEPPIWAGLLASHARDKGLRVEILDANALGLCAEDAAAVCAERGAALTAVVVYGHNPNASTQVMPAAGAICAELASRGATTKTLLIGGHVAALPERTLAEETVDFVCDGEGPYTLVALVEALRAGGSTQALSEVPGLLFRDGEQTVHTAAAPLVTDLDAELPGIAWDLLPMERYRAHNWHCFGGHARQPYAALYTTLGCPFRCSFCCIQAPFKSGEKALGYRSNVNSYRRWSPQRIAEQIEVLARRYGVRNIKLADELFLLHKPHVEQICARLIELDLDLNIWAYARIDTATDEALLQQMRRAGIRWLALGIESANEQVRAGVDKGYKPNTAAECVARIQRNGIHVVGNYIFGLPDDDLASMQETLEFAKRVNTEYANFNSAMAYPGSALYREALQRGWPLPRTWDGYAQHSRACLPLPTKHLRAEQVLEFRDRAFHDYFDRPEFHAMAEQTFGPAVAQEIGQMTRDRLERNHLARDTVTA
ncbi:MAG: cobalamin-dependent protein [Planctomycetes bacterium]|nr:cobalamin-dependent protein [Planctomycetota bacterium]